MDQIPTQLWDSVKDNIVVQWFMVIIFILLVGTNTATKLKGPLGGFARWIRKIGENRDEREAQERRKARERMIAEARGDREYVDRELHDLKTKVDSLMSHREAAEALVDLHLGWDYDRRKDLIDLGVKPTDIPVAPPLRVTARRLPDPEDPALS